MFDYNNMYRHMYLHVYAIHVYISKFNSHRSTGTCISYSFLASCHLTLHLLGRRNSLVLDFNISTNGCNCLNPSPFNYNCNNTNYIVGPYCTYTYNISTLVKCIGKNYVFSLAISFIFSLYIISHV